MIRGGGGQKQLTQLCPHCDDKITCTSFGPMGSSALGNNYKELWNSNSYKNLLSQNARKYEKTTTTTTETQGKKFKVEQCDWQ